MNKKQYDEKRKSLLAEAKALLDKNDVKGFNAKKAEIESLDSQYETQATAQANLSVLENHAPKAPAIVIDTPAATGETKPIDMFGSMEYRKAFMNYCKTGERSSKLQFRNAAESTSTTDAGAVIPSTIVQEVIKELKSYGQVYNLVRKLAIKGGVTVPILSLKPVANWIEENTSGDAQKVSLSTNVSFSYYTLECKVAASLVADVTTLDLFEQTIVSVIVEAMTKALDIGVVKGSGAGSMTGITVDSRIPANHVITLKPSEFIKWEAWKKKVFAKLPMAYKGGSVFLMASGTFEGYIDGMVDTVGQPVGRVNYGISNGPANTFGGKQVVEVEDDVINNFDDAVAGDVVAIYGNLSNYAINSNMQMTMYRYIDHNTNQYVDKALLIADGKVLDPNAFIVVKKGTDA